MYQSIKTYTNDVGLSCCFRQWRATHSHCQFSHGYAIGVEITFESPTLDNRNWAFDFGSCKPIKQFLEDTFDHKTVVAEDDPELEFFKEMDQRGICQLVILPAVGCEMFAKFIFDKVDSIVTDMQTTGNDARYNVTPDVYVKSVRVFEHGANAARYTREDK